MLIAGFFGVQVQLTLGHAVLLYFSQGTSRTSLTFLFLHDATLKVCF